MATALGALGFLVVLFAFAGVFAWSRSGASSSGGTTSTPGGARPTDTGAALFGAPAPTVPDVPATATFDVQSRVTGYQTSFYVLGFVTNTSPFTIDKPKITAVLLDQSGKEVATRDGYADSDALAPKATTPVKVLVSDPPAHASIKYEVVVKKASYIPEEVSGLRLEVLEAPHATFGSSWEVTGKVVNGGNQAARFVNIHVLAFDAKNHLIGLESTYVDGEALAVGASGRFRAMPLYDVAPNHFRYTVSGRPAK